MTQISIAESSSTQRAFMEMSSMVSRQFRGSKMSIARSQHGTRRRVFVGISVHALQIQLHTLSRQFTS